MTKPADITPLVSIYVATYNHEKYIRDCLNGILSQKTTFPYEILVIDDASTDNNQNIIEEYAINYPNIIRPFLLKENYYRLGRSKIYEIFFPNARGKYIAFCEGDDYWISDNKLQIQVDFLETHHEYSMCCHNYKIINESFLRKTPKLTHIESKSDITINQLLFENIVQTATVVARIDMLLADSYLRRDIYDNKFNFTDVRFFISYYNSGKIFGFDEYWSVYRINDNSVTSINIEKRVLNNHSLLDEICQCYDGKFSFLKRRVEFHKQLDFWTLNRWKGQYINALYHLTHALILLPDEFFRIYYRRYFINLSNIKKLFGRTTK